MSASELSRRRFLQLAALAAASTAVPKGVLARSLLPALPPLPYDDGSNSIPPGVAGTIERVIVIGAGFAGLAVANALTTAGILCVVLEARDRIGGRAHTVDVGGSPVDVGCSWITDPVGNPMTQFASQSGVLQTNASIELDVPESRFYDDRTGVVLQPSTLQAALHALRFEEIDASNISAQLGPNASTKEGILTYIKQQKLTGDDARFAEYFLRLIVELPDATDWDLDSLQWWANGSSPYIGFGEGDFPVGGYERITRSLGASTNVLLRHRVTDVSVGRDGVRVVARDAAGARHVFKGSHAVVTVPLGVLKGGTISFSPALPRWKSDAIRRIGMGTFEKVVMRFPEPYWATEHAHIFHLSSPEAMDFPLIIDLFFIEKVPILVAFNTGRHAIRLDDKSDREITSHMMGILRRVQGGPIPRPTDVFITRWGHDPYSRGSYSYLKLGSSPADQRALAEPVGGRLLFAGEASNQDRYGYADGAFSTGIREAKRLLRARNVQLRAQAL